MIRVEHGDCMDVLPRLAAEGVRVHAVVTDPPYHLTSIVKRFGGTNAAPAKDRDGLYKRASAGFMGKQWDGGDVAFRPETWAAVMAVMRPGAHLLAFGGTRTYHRLAAAIEDAGFEVRDAIMWHFGAGFPKSHSVSKAIDRAAGAEREIVGPRTDGRYAYPQNDIKGGRLIDGTNGAHVTMIDRPSTDAARQWDGWGTAVKPATEIICLARVPLIGTVAANVLAHGTGALNIDGCRIATSAEDQADQMRVVGFNVSYGNGESGIALAGSADGSLHRRDRADFDPSKGRWPANIIHDGSPEVMAAFAAYGEGTSGRLQTHHRRAGGSKIGTFEIRDQSGEPCDWGGDSGTAARFFYSAKADTDDRLGSKHPTVKPVDLMAYLCRLVTPPGGTVLDPFAGTGTTGAACMREGFDCILIEREQEYLTDIRRRLDVAVGADTPLFQAAP